MNLKRLLFVHNSLRTFVHLDRDLLAPHYALTEVCIPRNAQGVGALARALKALPTTDIIFIWFASYHALLPAVLGCWLGKKVVVCSSDYDLANEPRFNYGSMRGGLTKALNNLTFRAAHSVIVPSHFSRQLALQNTCLARNPAKIHRIPHGLPPSPHPATPKQPRAITVATLHRETNWRKGIEVFVQAAQHLPAWPFDVVGGALDDSTQVLRRAAPANVQFHGEVPAAQRDALLAQAAVYAQLSYMEGFGLAVAEAMLQHCVPVVTRRGALPEVVGECGIYVDYGDPAAAAQGMQAALQQPALGRRARERVLDCFSLAQRAEQLQAVLER